MCKSSNKFIYLYTNIATLYYEKLHSLTVKKNDHLVSVFIPT